MTLFTIGHSTRALSQFVDTLTDSDVKAVADVRRYPTSRRNPQYSADELKKSLFHAGIEYHYLGDELGGMRKPVKESRHPCLAGSGFQSYADWMETPMFRAGVGTLLSLAASKPTVTMCAERDPTACHRYLLSDYVTLIHGVQVVNLLDPQMCRPHPLTPGVHRDGDRIQYLPPKMGTGLAGYVDPPA